MTDTPNPTSEAPVVGRNEPCPCGSGKKYKRCHGVNAAGKISQPKPMEMPEGASQAAGAAGFDPSQMDPQLMMQFTQALQRLPKGQLVRMQQLMQKAMSGKDISKDAESFEKSLPLELQNMVRAMMPGLAGGAEAENIAPTTNASASPAAVSDEQKKELSKFRGFWSKMFKK